MESGTLQWWEEWQRWARDIFICSLDETADSCVFPIADASQLKKRVSLVREWVVKSRVIAVWYIGFMYAVHDGGMWLYVEFFFAMHGEHNHRM